MNREAVLSIALSGMILTVAVFGGLYYETLRERDAAIQQRDLARQRQIAEDVCVQNAQMQIGTILASQTNGTILKLELIGAYLDFGNCLAKIP